jgi:O-methyltransferase
VLSGQASARYLELIKRCLTREIFLDEEARELRPTGWRGKAWAPVRAGLARLGVQIVRRGGDPVGRAEGRGWPGSAETMIGMQRLDNVQECVTDVIRRGVPGDLIETGVWRGGTCIFMRAILAAFHDSERRVWVADSFQGLPSPDPQYYAPDQDLTLDLPWLVIPLEQVKANFARYGLLDDQVEFLSGWFKDTLPSAPIEQLAVIRLDGDLYESTIEAISALYPKLSMGGYLIIDDYGCIEECRRAIADYRAEHGITEEIKMIDWTGAYWQRLR